MVGVLFLAIFAKKLVKFDGNIQGCGIPQIEINIKKDLYNIRPLISMPLMMLSSLLSVFCGLPLATGGSISCYISGLLGQLVNEKFSKYRRFDDQNVIAAMGAGLVASFGSVLSGIAYAYEEVEEELKLKNMFYVALMSIIAYIVSRFLGPDFYSYFRIEKINTANYFYIYIIVALVNIALSILFLKILPRQKKFINKHYKNVIIKNRIYILFFITAIFLFFLPLATGPGLNLLTYDFKNVSILLILLFLVVRILFMLLSTNSTASGGQILPEMTIGYLVGIIISRLFNLDASTMQIIALTSMISFTGAINKTPLTMIFLGVSFAGLSNMLYSVLPILLSTIIVSLPIYLFKIDDINDALLKLLKTSKPIRKRSSK